MAANESEVSHNQREQLTSAFQNKVVKYPTQTSEITCIALLSLAVLLLQ